MFKLDHSASKALLAFVVAYTAYQTYSLATMRMSLGAQTVASPARWLALVMVAFGAFFVWLVYRNDRRMTRQERE